MTKKKKAKVTIQPLFKRVQTAEGRRRASAVKETKSVKVRLKAA